MNEPQKILIQILFLRKLIRNSGQCQNIRAFARFGIGVTKYEICSNLKLIQIKNISTLSESLKITYKINENLIENHQINIQNSSYHSQIEQIKDTALVISGGLQNWLQRFIIHETNKRNQEFLMKFKRRLHRTRFNQKYLIFIISGISNENNLIQNQPACEIFNLRNQIFSEIQPIKYPVQFFGCDQYNSQLYVFGGFNFKEREQKDIIQVYDCQQNA